MDYREFRDIFNRHIFGQSKADLIEKIAKYPERYTGLFRPTHPKAKIIQNLLQSHEIRFGDAFETFIREFMASSGFSNEERGLRHGEEILQLDQLFCRGERVFFVEHKIRDDHDSTKKIGQIKNFEAKAKAVIEIYGRSNTVGFFYFIDDNFAKNINYYRREIERLSSHYGVELHLCYGSEFFDLLDLSGAWGQIIDYLDRWRKEMPDIPDINFDADAEASVAEIRDLSKGVYKKLLSNDKLDGVLKVLFPQNETLGLLKAHFMQMDREQEGQGYQELAELCQQKIERLSSE